MERIKISKEKILHFENQLIALQKMEEGLKEDNKRGEKYMHILEVTNFLY